MTREQFWKEFEKLYGSGNPIELRKLIADHREYFKEKLDQIDLELSDPNSEIRKQYDKWAAEIEPKLEEYYG